MIEGTVAVQVTSEGMIPIPAKLSQQLGLKPLQTVYLKEDNGFLLVMRSREEIGKRIISLLQEGLQGLTQNDLDKDRLTNEDRGWYRIFYCLNW